MFFFFFQAEDGIRDKLVTGVQTCALPISSSPCPLPRRLVAAHRSEALADRRKRDARAARAELLQGPRHRRDRLGPGVEVALEPACRESQVVPVSRLVAPKERKPRVQQAQL